MKPFAAKLVPLAAAWLGAAALASAQPASSQLDVYVTASTDYITRGMSQTDGDGALQVGVGFQHHSGLIAGAWAHNVDYASEAYWSEPRRGALDLYLGYGRDRDTWSWTVALDRYTYPDAGIDYDYTSASASVSWRRRLAYSATYIDEPITSGSSALSHELSAYLPLDGNVELSAAIGRFDYRGPFYDDYSHWNVGVSKIIRRFSIDARFYDADSERVSLLGRPADRRWVLSVSMGLSH